MSEIGVVLAALARQREPRSFGLRCAVAHSVIGRFAPGLCCVCLRSFFGAAVRPGWRSGLDTLELPITVGATPPFPGSRLQPLITPGTRSLLGGQRHGCKDVLL